MSNDKDALIEKLGMGISRRKMLKGMGYGLAGAAIAPTILEEAWASTRGRPGVLLSDFTPVPSEWEYLIPNQGSVAVLENGRLTFSTVAARSGNLLYTFKGIDVQGGNDSYSYQLPAGVVVGDSGVPPLVVNGALYFISSNSIYALDVATGRILWNKSYRVVSARLTSVGGNLLFAAFSSTGISFYCLDANGNQLWAYDTNDNLGGAIPSWTIVSAGQVIFTVYSTFYAVDLYTGAGLWSAPLGNFLAGNPEIGSPLTIGGGNIYYVLDDSDFNGNYTSSLCAFSIGSKQALGAPWPITRKSGSFTSPPVYYNGVVYVGSSGGTLNAFDPNSGALLWQTTVQGGDIGDTIFIEDGTAYFVGGTAILYAMDLASRGADLVPYTIPTTDQSPYIIGVETGVCYYQTIYEGYHAIRAVNLGGLIHQFFCESELMVEDYTSVNDPINGGQKAQGNMTSYRTHVQLFDPNKNPRADKSVKIWAADAVTITSGGQTYNIDANNTAWLTTDRAGELSIVSSAATISSPALYLWGNFMEVNEAIVIYPDHDTLHTLSNVQSGDLSRAMTYDNTPMLPSGYSGTEDLASTIRNTMGGGAAQAMLKTKERHRQALAKKRRTKKRWSLGAAADTTYVAYPDSAPNLLYQPIAGPADRTYVPGTVPQWTATFDDSGNINFNAGLSLEGPELLGSFLGDLKKLGHDVVNTAVKVSKVVWDDVQKVVNVVVNAAGDFYRDVADTIEKAVAVVAGVLKTVVGDIKKAVEWLSYLFNWDDMLATKELLKTAARQNLNNLKTWVDNQISSDAQAVHAFFQGLQKTVKNDLAQASAAIGGNTLQSKQVNGNNPQSLYGAGGGKSYTKSRWLTQKFQDNAAGTTIGISATGTDPDDPILTAFQTLSDDVSNIIAGSPELQAIPTDVKKVFQDFTLLVTNPSDFVTHAFGDVITLITDITVDLLGLADAIVESVLNALKALVDAIIDFLANQPLNIPVLSSLYGVITHGSQLTFLDLCCLIVAVPTTIIGKAISSRPQAGGQLSATGLPLPAALVIEIGYACSYAVYIVLDALAESELLPTNAGMWAYVGMNVMYEGLSFPEDLAANTTGDYFFYAAQFFSPIITAVGIRLNTVPVGSLGKVNLRLWWSLLIPFVYTAYGLAMVGASIGLGIERNNYRGPYYTTMIENIFGFTPYIFKPLTLGEEIGKLALSLIDLVCYTTDLGVWVGIEIADSLNG